MMIRDFNRYVGSNQENYEDQPRVFGYGVMCKE